MLPAVMCAACAAAVLEWSQPPHEAGKHGTSEHAPGQHLHVVVSISGAFGRGRGIVGDVLLIFCWLTSVLCRLGSLALLAPALLLVSAASRTWIGCCIRHDCQRTQFGMYHLVQFGM